MMEYSGQCACGNIQFVCDGDPLFTQYCHCNKCREVASLSKSSEDKRGYAYTAAYLTKHFKIISGQDRLEDIVRNNARLYLCNSCKSMIYGISVNPELQAGIGINAYNFHFDKLPQAFIPVRHIWYPDRVVDVNDDLPKFKDAPVEQRGSGERCD